MDPNKVIQPPLPPPVVEGRLDIKWLDPSHPDATQGILGAFRTLIDEAGDQMSKLAKTVDLTKPECELFDGISGVLYKIGLLFDSDLSERPRMEIDLNGFRAPVADVIHKMSVVLDAHPPVMAQWDLLHSALVQMNEIQSMIDDGPGEHTKQLVCLVDGVISRLEDLRRDHPMLPRSGKLVNEALDLQYELRGMLDPECEEADNG